MKRSFVEGKRKESVLTLEHALDLQRGKGRGENRSMHGEPSLSLLKEERSFPVQGFRGRVQGKAKQNTVLTLRQEVVRSAFVSRGIIIEGLFRRKGRGTYLHKRKCRSLRQSGKRGSL